MSDDVRICSRDGAPLVFTFEFPGAEYVCVECGATEPMLGLRAEPTPELARRLSDAFAVYEREAAVRAGRPAPQFVRVGDEGVRTPTCRSCGAEPEIGLILRYGKPPGWFSKQADIGRAKVTVYACSSACIPPGEGILPW